MNKSLSYSSEYILPNLKTNPSPKLSNYIDSLAESNKDFFQKYIKFEELLSFEKLFIIGEPGFGKSRLLKQLFTSFENLENKCCFIDLKDVNPAKGNLEQYISRKLKEEPKSLKKTQGLADFKSSENFDLKNLNSRVLFFDGLDEVHVDVAPILLDEIATLSRDFPLIKIFLTCRTHHVSRYKNQLFLFDFDCAELQPFTIRQTLDFLISNCKRLKNFNQEDLLNRLGDANLYHYSIFSNTTNNTLNTPRYLNVLSELINQKGFDEVIQLSRSELFDLFIFERLKKESNTKGTTHQKSYTSKILYLKQCLERLALIMEIQRVNQISKDDFVTFLLDTNLNLDSQILLEIFFDGTILKDGGGFLEFDNTEFQEYLAAKAISRLGKAEQIIFDLAIEQRLENVYESWKNVLTYLCEIEPQLLQPIIHFACTTDNPELFELIKYPKPTFFENKEGEKQKIFNSIFTYFSFKKKVFPYPFERSLKNLYSHEFHHEKLLLSLKSKDKLESYINRTNAIRVISEVINEDKLPPNDAKKWKHNFINFAKEKSEYGDSVLMACINSLSKMKNVKIEELKPFLHLAEHPNKPVRQTIFHALLRINPNHPTTIDMMIKAIKEDKFSSLDDIDKIESLDGFKYFLNCLLKKDDSENPRKNLLFIINESMHTPFDNNDNFFSNLEEKWDDSLEPLIFDILMATCKEHYQYHSVFFDKLCLTLKNKNPTAAKNFGEHLDMSTFNKDDYYWVSDIMGRLITTEQLDVILSFQNKNSLPENFTLWVIRESHDSKVGDLEKKYYPVIARSAKKHLKEREKKRKIRLKKSEARKTEIYNTFIAKLNSGDDSAIQHYVFHSKDIEGKLTAPQKRKLKKFLENILRTTEPKDGTVHFKEHHRYAAPIFEIYENTVKLADKFKIDLTPFRSKILKLVATTFDLQTLLKFVPNITGEEAKEFFDWFLAKRKDDLHFHRIHNIISFCKKTNYKDAAGFLIKLVENKNIEFRYRQDALDVVFPWKEISTGFLNKVFRDGLKTKEDSDDYKFSIYVNKLLLKNNNEEALNWRMNYVHQKKYKINRHFTGMRGMLHEEGIGRELGFITDIKSYDNMLTFLEQSFSYLQKDSDYYDFVQNEIWQPVLNFFRNQKHRKHNFQDYIKSLKNLVQKHIHIPLADGLSYHIETLNREFNLYLGEPAHFAGCIQKYQIIKSKQYLDIVYPDELFQLIKNVINIEFRQIVNQGLYGFINDLYKSNGGKIGKERIIQKSIVDILENLLLKKGLRNSDIKEVHPKFYREVEILDGKKIDLIISYGGIGSVMVEIKRADNSELGSQARLKKYQEDTFLPYLKQTNCDFGIFLIFKDNPNKPKKLESKIKGVKKAYADFHNIEVIGIDCTKS